MGKQSITYQELYKEVTFHYKRINSLNTLRCIGILLNNSIDYIKAYFSITFSDNVIIPIKPESTLYEISNTVQLCNLRMIITDSKKSLYLQHNESIFKNRFFIYDIQTSQIIEINKNANEHNSIEENNYLDENTAILIQTSGTTSNPKIVMLSHTNIISNLLAIVESLKINKDDKTLIHLPLYLSSGHMQMLTHLYVGATCIINNRYFIPRQFYNLIIDNEITNTCCVPFILHELLKYDKQNILGNLKLLCIGATKTPKELLRQTLNRYPETTIVNYYGLTEASPRVSHMFLNQNPIKLDSCGKPLTGIEVEIRDSDGNKCDIYDMGVIFVRGNNIMNGYYKNPIATSKVLIDGWLNTGDIGYLDEDGYIYIKGRQKNVIISNGINIFPEEIEEILVSYPYIEEAYVYGIDHAYYQEDIEAKIVINSEQFEIKHLLEYCQNNMSYYKIPSKFIICDSIDKTESGKIKRK